MSFDELKKTYYLYKKVYSYSSFTCALLALKWFLLNSSNGGGVVVIAIALILIWMLFFGIHWHG